jgi:hypothetical protein
MDDTKLTGGKSEQTIWRHSIRWVDNAEIYLREIRCGEE